jgi:cholera toxin transcriptional activator
VRLHLQPFQLLLLFLRRPGELLTREEICGELWPNGTFVDFEQGLNSAVGRLREALGDRAGSPRFVETLARRGYRFVAPVEVVEAHASEPEQESCIAANGVSVMAPAEAEGTGPEPVSAAPGALPTAGVRWLAQAQDLPRSSARVVRGCFVGLQVMYLAFYVGTLANLAEVRELMAVLPGAAWWYGVVVASAATMIPVRLTLLTGIAFRTPGFARKFLRMWPILAIVDVAWALSPLLLLNHMSFGLALACAAPLVYAPFAARSLVLMESREPV